MAVPSQPPPEPPFTATGIILELRSRSAVLTLDPNTAILRAMKGLDLAAALGAPCVPSELSRRPGYFYDTLDAMGAAERPLRLRLTEAEATRLILHRLRRHEVQLLRSRHGEFYEIHGDFYDPDGRALQPA